MIPIGNHGLKCPGPEDYAAIALYMQDQALAIEAALDGVSDALDTFSLRPGATATTTAVNGPVSSGSEQIFGLGNWTITSSNFLPVPGNTGGIQMTTPRTGWYEHGAYVNAVAAGAVTALSRRTVYSRAYQITSLGDVLLNEVVWRTIDTNTAGEFLVACGGTFYARAGTRIDIRPGWSHTNAASMVQVNAGARTWCFYIGSGIEIGSA